MEHGKAPYQTMNGNKQVFVHPSSVLFAAKKLPEYVVYSELLLTSKLYMRNLNAIDVDMIPISNSRLKFE
jgi:hypothetical protein